MQIQDIEHMDGQETTTQEQKIQEITDEHQDFKVLSKEELSKLSLAQ